MLLTVLSILWKRECNLVHALLERLPCIRFIAPTLSVDKNTVHSCSGMSKFNDLRMATNSEKLFKLYCMLTEKRADAVLEQYKKISWSSSLWGVARQSEREWGKKIKMMWSRAEAGQRQRQKKSRASWTQLVWHQSSNWFLSSSHAHWTHIWFFRLLEEGRQTGEKKGLGLSLIHCSVNVTSIMFTGKSAASKLFMQKCDISRGVRSENGSIFVKVYFNLTTHTTY